MEQLNYNVEKRGGRGKLISQTMVKVNKSIYQKWDLNRLSEISFREWYDGEGHRNLFTEGKFIHSKGSQYHSLVKRYNVFIEFLNRKTGDYDKDMQLCEDIMKKYQKERFDQIKRDEPRSRKAKPFNERIHKDIKECEKTILAVCEGKFPKE